jgi:hypothetical protein
MWNLSIPAKLVGYNDSSTAVETAIIAAVALTAEILTLRTPIGIGQHSRYSSSVKRLFIAVMHSAVLNAAVLRLKKVVVFD